MIQEEKYIKHGKSETIPGGKELDNMDWFAIIAIVIVAYLMVMVTLPIAICEYLR